ncbi:hypothetical protein BKA57DRAFT_441511 [Linnemannia elongata]|nr:hypothetical protein BKA57DRAFT_441511 [Linnemannia elongata]
MSTLSSAAKVLNIPELSEIILQDFTPHDFAQCILVCKSFASIFTPILWHTIALKQDNQHVWFSTSPEGTSPTAAAAGTTGPRTRTPTRDWLRYNGMFLMRRRYFIDRLYRQRQLHALHQQQVARQQLRESLKNTNDPNCIAVHLKEKKEKLAQLEQECLVQERKFPTVAMGLGPSLVEQDLELLRSKIRETKEEMEKVRRASSLPPPPGAGLAFNNDGYSNNNPSIGLWKEGGSGFCMGYEKSDEVILEQFLGQFPHLKTLMTTSLPFLGQGVIRTVVELDSLRSLSLTIYHASLPAQVANVHTLLNTCPPNLEILRLSFMDKDDGTVDMMPGTAHPRSRDSTATATLPPAEMFGTSTSSAVAGPPTTTSNSIGPKDEGDARLDLVRLSIQRAGPMRFLRRLFIEGTLGDPELTKTNTIDHPSADSQTWVAFLERCPNLLTLSLGGCSVMVLPEVGQSLKLYCPRLEDFAVGHRSYLGTPSYENLDPNLAILLSSLTGLKRLRIDTFALETSSRVLGVIQTRFTESLTEISLNDCKYLRLRFLEESHSIFSLLQALKNIESLDLLPSGEIFHSFEHTLGCPRFVSEVFSKPWTCQGSLRVLSYSDKDMDEDMDDMSLFEPSAEDHEQGPVYGAFKFVGIQSTCLALSLTHGLDLMSGLKRLKIFNVARMDHLIEMEEVEFMMEQWPELEFVPGLLRGASKLHKPTLTNFLRTNHHFNAIGTPFLYTSFDVSAVGPGVQYKTRRLGRIHGYSGKECPSYP